MYNHLAFGSQPSQGQAAPAPAFGFGAPKAPESIPATSFGSTTGAAFGSTTPQTTGAAFGSSTPQTTGATFGSTTPQTTGAAFGSTPSSTFGNPFLFSHLAFGTSTQQPSQTQSTFGSQPAATTSFSFGQGNNAFSSSSTSNAPFGSPAPPSNGMSMDSSTPQTAAPFAFGGAPSSTNTSTFAFGGATTQPTAFGGATTQQPPAFGSAPTQQAPSFGQSTPNAAPFGQPSQFMQAPPTPFGQAPPITSFGQPPNQSSPNVSFNFGSQSSPAAPVFQFNANPSSPVPGSPGQPAFSFGASSGGDAQRKLAQPKGRLRKAGLKR